MIEPQHFRSEVAAIQCSPTPMFGGMKSARESRATAPVEDAE